MHKTIPSLCIHNIPFYTFSFPNSTYQFILRCHFWHNSLAIPKQLVHSGLSIFLPKRFFAAISKTETKDLNLFFISLSTNLRQNQQNSRSSYKACYIWNALWNCSPASCSKWACPTHKDSTFNFATQGRIRSQQQLTQRHNGQPLLRGGDSPWLLHGELWHDQKYTQPSIS